MPFNVGPLELVIVLVIALLILGPGRLPEVGSALGKSIREFRKAATDVQDATKLDATPKPNQSSIAETSSATPAPAAEPQPSPEAGASAEDPKPNELSESPKPNELSQPRA
jgi:sec-independent protein translocase protein TatA